MDIETIIKLKNILEVKYREFVNNNLPIEKWDDLCERNGIRQKYTPLQFNLCSDDGEFVIMWNWMRGAGYRLEIPIETASKMLILGCLA